MNNDLLLKVILTSLPININNMDNILINLENLETLPVVEVELGNISTYNLENAFSDELKVLIYILLGITLSISILYIIGAKKKQNELVLSQEEESIASYNYTGKLNIYITRTKKDFDFPLLTFNLFYISDNRKISLHEILKKLDIKEIFEGANNIYFMPSANRKIIVINESNCTLLNNHQIVLKGKSIELFSNSKLDISFEDEISEIVLQYKDINKIIHS